MDDLVMGAMGSLIPKLHELLKEYNLQTGVKEDMSCLTQELEVMQATLYKVAQLPWDQLDKQVQLWARQVRETSYDMEDTLDTFLVCVEDSDSSGQESLLKHLVEKMTNLFKKSKISGNVMSHLQEFIEPRREYNVNDNVAKLGTASTVADPCLRPTYSKVKKLVGMDESSDKLISLLQSPERGHTFNMKTKVVSIVGVGGSGKTTLARTVYDKLEGDFDCSTFVRVGRNPNLKELLQHILLVLDKRRELWFSRVVLLDESQLATELRFFLRKKRYFIVVDDIWEVQSWEKIRLAIDDGNNCGGTILITTRNFEVALEANYAVYRLKPLSFNTSRKLLYTRIYGHEGRYVDNQPDEISDKILKECDGIPLAIMIMAGLLMGKQRHEWSEVYKTIGFGLKEDHKEKGNTTWILSFCYYGMPSHLRTCLLYTSAFPEGYVIPKDSLIWMWIAEGFIHPKQGKRLFEIGEGYFNDLINRGMIEAVQSDYDGSIINGCRVHEIVLDLICFMSCEENFFTLMDNKGTLAHSNVRRLAHHNMTGGQINQVNYIDIPKVRSFISLGCGMEVIPLASFKLLRVLTIESGRRTDNTPPLNAEHLGHLHHLRFLGLRRTRIHNDISKEIRALRFLQTLDLWDTVILYLPSCRLPERLMCLHVTFDDIKHGVGDPEVNLLAQLTSLEELSIAVKWNNTTATRQLVKELGRLRELRVLDASIWWNEDEETPRDLVESIGHLHKLEHLRIQCYFWWRAWRATELVLPCHLRYLALSGVSELPSCINPCCLPSLSHLDLSLEYADEKDLKILGWLPELRFLTLSVKDIMHISDAVIAPGAFPKLQYFYNMSPLVLTFLPGAMPCLECFKFNINVQNLKDYYLGFGHFYSLCYLPSLEKIHARTNGFIDYSAKVLEEAEAALRDVAQSHPNHPNLILNIKRGDMDPSADKQTLRDKLHHSHGKASDVVPLELLKQMTNGFSEDQKLGKGNFGTVYKGEMSSTLSTIEFPTSSSQGTIGPLLTKLHLLLHSENQLIRGPTKEAIKLLKKDMEEINADLVDLSMVERPNYKTRYWMHEVRELSYHIEDCIDNMMQSRAAAEAKVRFSVRRPHLRVCRHVKIPWLPKTVQPSTRIAELRTLLWEARERHEKYQLEDCVSSEPRFLFSAKNSRAPASLSSEAPVKLVGDGTREKLTSWLIDQTEAEQQQLKVLSILGPAGVGKTALAKELYHKLGHQFECRAFVRVSRNPDMKRILGEILSQVQGCKQDYEYDATSTADKLMDSITSHLQDKRYFVVIDELWDAAAWDIMSISFPEGNNCSRIIITAEGKDVARKCYSVNTIEMIPLGSLQDSGRIFFDRVFGSESQCFGLLKGISYTIIRSCSGFPLAITTIASLLASQIDNATPSLLASQIYNAKLLHHIQQCFSSRLTGLTSEETCKEVVNICYDTLPHDLKTCLLYLTMYPEGSTIRKADLLNQWIAEGFISPTETKHAVAESNFAELVSRGIIQPEKVDHNDEVLSCTVHHIVFDLISQKAREENFITEIDYSQVMPGFSMIARRLSLHFSCAQFAAKPEGLKLSQVRSLAFYGLLKCMPSITESKFLRVLILEFRGDNYHHNMSLDLSKLCILFHLRYLKVSSHTIIVLPSKIQRLQSLETLEINAKVSAVPTDILHLPGLLHLSLPNGIELPDGIGCITSLQTLEHFDLGSNSEYNAQSLGELINLHNLHVTCSKAVSNHHLGWDLLRSLNEIFPCYKKSDHHLKRNLVALSSSIGRLANLKSLRVGPFALGMTMSIDQDDMLCTPKLLQRLELLPSSLIFSRLPAWIGALQKLCILKIAVRVLLSSDIDTLTGLPVLAVVSLYVQKSNAESVVFNSGSLPALKYFKYRCAALRLAFQKEALPNLQRLKLCFNVHRAEYSEASKLAGIENLLKLKEITAEIGAAAGADKLDRRAAETALKEATRKHPQFPIHMNVKSVDCIEEESTPARFMHLIPYIAAFLTWLHYTGWINTGWINIALLRCLLWLELSSWDLICTIALLLCFLWAELSDLICTL